MEIPKRWGWETLAFTGERKLTVYSFLTPLNVIVGNFGDR